MLSVDGVVRFLQFEGKLAIISETEINAIRISLLDNLRVSYRKFNKGDHMVVIGST